MTKRPIDPHAAALPLTVLILGLTLAGCASLPENKNRTTEEKLSAAGFQKKVAASPEELARLASVTPQRKLMTASLDGQPRYAWVDAEHCGCIYAGTPLQLNHLRNLEAKEAISEQQILVSRPKRQDEILRLWGLWLPPLPAI